MRVLTSPPSLSSRPERGEVEGPLHVAAAGMNRSFGFAQDDGGKGLPGRKTAKELERHRAGGDGMGLRARKRWYAMNDHAAAKGRAKTSREFR